PGVTIHRTGLEHRPKPFYFKYRPRLSSDSCEEVGHYIYDWPTLGELFLFLAAGIPPLNPDYYNTRLNDSVSSAINTMISGLIVIGNGYLSRYLSLRYVCVLFSRPLFPWTSAGVPGHS